VNSLVAVNYHLRDEYWRRGLTVHAMLTHNFVSRISRCSDRSRRGARMRCSPNVFNRTDLRMGET